MVPHHHAPTRFLESLESTLLAITAAGRPPRVEVAYREQVAPAGLAPLLEAAEAEALGVRLIGIEVTPSYRDGATGELYPLELQELHHGLARALTCEDREPWS